MKKMAGVALFYAPLYRFRDDEDSENDVGRDKYERECVCKISVHKKPDSRHHEGNNPDFISLCVRNERSSLNQAFSYPYAVSEYFRVPFWIVVVTDGVFDVQRPLSSINFTEVVIKISFARIESSRRKKRRFVYGSVNAGPRLSGVVYSSDDAKCPRNRVI